jgi:predicted permease
MDWLGGDLRAAGRLITRRPIHVLLAVVTLAVGLGLNAIAFSAINSLLFRAARVAAGEDLGWISVGLRTEPEPLGNMSLPMYERLRRDAQTLQSLAAEGRLPLAYETGNTTEQIWALVVSPDYFSTVKVPLTFGRTWRPDETTPESVTGIVSERFWRSRLGASRDLANLSLRINRQTVYVVGVVDDDFESPGGTFAPDMWVPLTAHQALGFPKSLSSASVRWLNVVARPNSGATNDAIVADVLPMVRDEIAGGAAAKDDVRVSFARIADGNSEVRSLRGVAAIGLAAVFTVLLIACFNVGGLVLARSVERQRELGIRSALGASRLRLVRQLVVENLMISVLAAAVAVALARWSATLLSAFSLPAPIPQRLHFPTDWRLLGYTGALAIVAATIPALVPAFQVLRTDLITWLKAGGGTVGGRRQTQTRRGFVLVQTAGSTFFLAAALLFGQGFLNALNHDVGFDIDRTAIVEIDPMLYGYTPERAERLVSQIRERLTTLAGVRNVTVADRLPFSVGIPQTRPISLDGRDCRVSRCVGAGTSAIDEQFFSALGISIRGGRTFVANDGPEAVVVSEVAAEQFWPGQSPLGQTFREGPEGQVRRVVGVVADITQRSIGESSRPHFYQALSRGGYENSLSIVVRTEARPDDLIRPLRDIVHSLDSGLPVRVAQTMRERMTLPFWMHRTLTRFFAVCGLLAVLLATAGLFGVTYYVVLQRTREFGVRLALGSTRGSLRSLVMGETLRLVFPGILFGVLAAFGAATVARSVLFGVSNMSPVAYLMAAAAQSLVTVGASWVPAIRAARVDPLVALRAE